MKTVRFIVRWLARVLSLVSIGWVLFFLVGEGLNPGALKLKDIVLLACFPVGISVGMLIAWRRELLGSLVTLASLGLFYLIHFLLFEYLPKGPAFLFFASPAIVFLVSAALERSGPTQAAGRPSPGGPSKLPSSSSG